MRARKLAVALAALTALGGAGASSAAAAESLYAPEQVSRDFSTSAGGWAGSVEKDDPLCQLGVTCPAVLNTFEGAGGAGGDGFIRTELSGLLNVTLLATERGIWSSPSFTYTGAEGKQPTAVSFGFKRRSDDESLLNVVGASATFGARLRDVTAGTVLDVVPAADATDLADWTAVPEAAVDPALLVVGHEYVIEIVTETTVPVGLIPAATFDYDDVVLRATAPGGPLGPELKGGVLGGAATLRGNILSVPVKCPASAPAKCRVRLVGKIGGRKSKSATKTGKVGVKPGKKKVAKLRVKPRFLARVQAKKKMTFRAKVSSGGVNVVTYRKLRIVRK
jgi:hypothetical protein